MRILALDFGRHTGWAATNKNGHRTSGTWDLGSGSAGERYIALRDHISDLHDVIGFDIVTYEMVRRHCGTDASHAYGGYLGVVQAWCCEQGVIAMPKEVAAIKHHATGHGQADKVEMMAAAFKRGWRPRDHNEADAMWLLDLTLTQFAQGRTRKVKK